MKIVLLKLWIFMTASLCLLKTSQAALSNKKIRYLSAIDWLNDVDGDNIPGEAGVDYPIHSTVPKGISFRCGRFEYAGYFADMEADCQAYHVCFPDGRNASFLCVNGTVFHQRYFVCDWWFHSNCSLAPDLYELNLYRKIPLPVLPPVRRRPFPQPTPQPAPQPGPVPQSELSPRERSNPRPGLAPENELKPRQRSNPGPASRPRSELTVREREGKAMSDDPKDSPGKRDKTKKTFKENILPPNQLTDMKLSVKSRNEDTCDCQCNNADYHQTK